VVVEQRVAFEALNAGRVMSQPLARYVLLKAKAVFAFFDWPRFAHHFVRATINGDRHFIVVVGVDDDLDIERLALADLGWQGEPFYVEVVINANHDDEGTITVYRG